MTNDAIKIDDWCISLKEALTGRKKGDILQIKSHISYRLNGHNCDDNFSESIHSPKVYNTLRFATLEEIAKVTGANFDFVLPEKWCVKFTDENKNILNKWRILQPKAAVEYEPKGWLLSDSSYCVSYMFFGNTITNLHSFDPFKEITFEQFKKYVLKEKDTSSIPEIPDTLKVADLVKGEIYCFKDNDTFVVFECERNGTTIGRGLRFGGNSNVYVINNTFAGHENSIKLAWFSDRQWLEKCIKLNKCIPKEEALKSKEIVTLEELRELVTYKAPTYRKEIKLKLECLGVSNLSNLDKKYYVEMKEFLISLDSKKEVEKWSVGSYVVYCTDFLRTVPVGTIGKCEGVSYMQCVNISGKEAIAISREEKGEIKWFATLEEAEVFAKTLTKESIPEYVECIEVPKGWSYTKKGVIYKTCSDGYPKGCYRILHAEGGGTSTEGYQEYFKPSTKEAYKAQFPDTSVPGDEDYAALEEDCDDYPCDTCSLSYCTECKHSIREDMEQEPNHYERTELLVERMKSNKDFVPLYVEPTTTKNVEKIVLLKQVDILKPLKFKL